MTSDNRADPFVIRSTAPDFDRFLDAAQDQHPYPADVEAEMLAITIQAVRTAPSMTEARTEAVTAMQERFADDPRVRRLIAAAIAEATWNTWQVRALAQGAGYDATSGVLTLPDALTDHLLWLWLCYESVDGDPDRLPRDGVLRVARDPAIARVERWYLENWEAVW
jgi:hypothetical protein